MTIINTLNASGVAKVIAGEEKPTSFPSVYPAPDGYDGWSKMTIEAPDNLTAENIKKDVEIAGVTGTYAGGSNGQFVALCQRTITEVTADDLAGATSLGNYCFYYCTSLSSVTIPDSVTSLGSYCFYNCTNLASVTIPSSVASLRNNCFTACTSLTSIEIPSGVTSLDYGCFSSCTNLASVTLPSSVTSLESNCFSNCKSLTSIEIPSGVTSLRSNCFYNCTNLASVTLSSSVTSLGTGCFSNCKSLTSIEIPSGVTSLGIVCFSDCTNLASVTMLPTTPPTLESSAFTNVSSNLVITVPKGCLDAYKNATNWSAYADKMVEASE